MLGSLERSAVRWRRRRSGWRRGRPAGPAGTVTRPGCPEARPLRSLTESRAHRGTVMHHARPVVVTPVPTTVAEVDPGAEDDGGHEDGPGDDHHPGRGLVQPVRWWRRWWRRRWVGNWRLAHTDPSCPTTTPAAALREGRRPVARGRTGLPAGWGWWRLGAHRGRRLTGSALLRSGPHRPWSAMGALVEHRVLAEVPVGPVPVVMSARSAAAEPDAGEEDRRHDEDDSGDDRDPGCEPVEPIGLGLTRRRGRGGWGGCDLRWCAHIWHAPGATPDTARSWLCISYEPLSFRTAALRTDHAPSVRAIIL